MADKTKIEWTDASWTPIRARYWENIGNDGGKERIGWHCEHVSEGCRNCYAESINRRLGTGFDFKPGHRRREIIIGGPRAGRDWHGADDGWHHEPRGDVEIFLDEKMLTQPFRWRTTRRIFVCSMTDLLADFVKDEWIDRMFAVMALCPQHTFQILTKRPERMRAWFNRESGCGAAVAHEMMDLAPVGKVLENAIIFTPRNPGSMQPEKWPLPNVWLGTSCEDQAAWDARIGHLRATPAAIRFVSFEPLLGEIDASNGIHDIDWAIVGGESGREARPMHPDWARSLRDQCAAAGAPFFFKQWGAWLPFKPEAGGDLGGMCRRGEVQIVQPGGEDLVKVAEMTGGRSTLPGARYMRRVGKANAGRTLDGKIHDGYPEPQE